MRIKHIVTTVGASSLLLLLTLPIDLHANILVVTRGTLEAGTIVPKDNTDVRVLHENLTLNIADFANGSTTPVVDVTAEYELHNDSPQEQKLSVAFPYVGAFSPTTRGFLQPHDTVGDTQFGSNVTLDGETIDSTIEDLPIPYAPRSPYISRVWMPVPAVDNERFLAAWKAWVARDADLTALLNEYSRNALDYKEYSAASQRFRDAANDLLDRNGLESELREYLIARAEKVMPRREILGELIAEADVSYRDQRDNYYISTIRYNTPLSTDQMNDFVNKIDAWIDHSPEVREAFVRYAGQIAIATSSEKFLTERLDVYLAERYKLSHIVRARFRAYVRDAYNPTRHVIAVGTSGSATRPSFIPETSPRSSELPTQPPDFWLVSQVDPDLEAERLDRIRRADEMLAAYGFDSTFLSPLTGKSYSRRLGWRDDSTWPILGIKAPREQEEGWLLNNSSDQRLDSTTVAQTPVAAKIIRFTVKLAPNQKRTLRVSYKTLAEMDELRRGDPAQQQLMQVRYILTTTRRWKSFGPIAITVILPARVMAVMDPPAANEAKSHDGKTIMFTATVTNPDRNLRIAIVPEPSRDSGPFSEQLRFEDQADLIKLLEVPELSGKEKKVLEYMLGITKSKRAGQQ